MANSQSSIQQEGGAKMELRKVIKSKKAIGVENLLTYGILMVAVAIVLGFGAQILADIQATQTSGTAAYNSSAGGLNATNTFASWLDNIALIIVAAVIIGIIIGSFMIYTRR